MDQNVKFADGKEQTVRAGQMYLGTRNWKPKHSLGQGSLVSPRQVERERRPNIIKWRKPKRAVLTKRRRLRLQTIRSPAFRERLLAGRTSHWLFV